MIRTICRSTPVDEHTCAEASGSRGMQGQQHDPIPCPGCCVTPVSISIGRWCITSASWRIVPRGLPRLKRQWPRSSELGMDYFRAGAHSSASQQLFTRPSLPENSVGGESFQNLPSSIRDGAVLGSIPKYLIHGRGAFLQESSPEVTFAVDQLI